MKKITHIPDFIFKGINYPNGSDCLEFIDKGKYWEVHACVDGTGNWFKVPKSLVKMENLT